MCWGGSVVELVSTEDGAEVESSPAMPFLVLSSSEGPDVNGLLVCVVVTVGEVNASSGFPSRAVCDVSSTGGSWPSPGIAGRAWVTPSVGG